MKLLESILPTLLSLITAIGLILLLLGSATVLNALPLSADIKTILIPADILVGITIYLKTSVDFAFAIGNLVKKYTGIKNQTIISVMTSLANGIGVVLVLIVWVIFKENKFLLALMLFVAAIALVNMAADGLAESPLAQRSILLRNLQEVLHMMLRPLFAISKFFFPSPSTKKKVTASLVVLSFSLPFILGLDDFAGYIPLFTIVNVVSFATGVIVGHFILLTLLFLRPEITRRILSFPIIEVIGSLVFLILGIVGLIEMVKLLIH